MITEQEILDLGFEREDYSTDEEQYYTIDISRVAKYKEYDSHQEYKLTVNDTAGNKYKLESTLKLAESFFAPTQSFWGNWTDVVDLEDKLTKLLTWDLQH